MKKQKLPPIIYLAIMTLTTSVLWIFFSLYRVFTEKPDTKVPTEILMSLSPTLDKEILSEIENAIFIADNQIPDTVSLREVPIEIPGPTPQAEADETEEIEEEEEEEATESADITDIEE